MATVAFLIDANVFIHASLSRSEFHSQARLFLDQHWDSEAAWYTTWPVLYEFLRITTHPKIYENPLTTGEALAFIESICENPSARILANSSGHFAALTRVVGQVADPRGSIFHDLHIVAMMREHGIAEIVTADKGFARFPGIRVTNPFL